MQLNAPFFAKDSNFPTKSLEKAFENSNDQKTFDNHGRAVECLSHHGVNIMFNVVMEFSRCHILSASEEGKLGAYFNARIDWY